MIKAKLLGGPCDGQQMHIIDCMHVTTVYGSAAFPAANANPGDDVSHKTYEYVFEGEVVNGTRLYTYGATIRKHKSIRLKKWPNVTKMLDALLKSDSVKRVTLCRLRGVWVIECEVVK